MGAGLVTCQQLIVCAIIYSYELFVHYYFYYYDTSKTIPIWILWKKYSYCITTELELSLKKKRPTYYRQDSSSRNTEGSHNIVTTNNIYALFL